MRTYRFDPRDIKPGDLRRLESVKEDLLQYKLMLARTLEELGDDAHSIPVTCARILEGNNVTLGPAVLGVMALAAYIEIMEWQLEKLTGGLE